jgi:hypothetical protein
MTPSIGSVADRYDHLYGFSAVARPSPGTGGRRSERTPEM